MGMERLSGSQENGVYLTSVTAGLHCSHLHGCTGVSIWASAGLTSASSVLTHLPEQGSQEKGCGAGSAR